MRHMEKIQRKRSRQGPGTFVLCPTHFTLCWSLLCLHFHFHFAHNSYLLIFSKYFRIHQPQAFSLFWVSPLASMDSISMIFNPHNRIVLLTPFLLLESIFPKDNSSHRVRTRCIWAQGLFQGLQALAMCQSITRAEEQILTFSKVTSHSSKPQI